MSHYFTNDQNLKSEERERKTNITGISFSFLTDNGVFSKHGLDFGTRTLLESLPDILEGEVLDFGCGYGPIGIFVAKKYPNTIVDMVDVNQRSLSLARKNADFNKVDVHIFESDVYAAITKKYDFIVTNPPIRVGKKILYQILFGAKDYLKRNGRLYLVIHKDQGAKTLVRDLEQTYQVSILTKNKGFYVICACNY